MSVRATSSRPGSGVHSLGGPGEAGPGEGGPGAAVAGALGRALAPLVGTVARVRRSRPMHPDGAVLRGRLLRGGLHGPAATGVTWLDSAGDDDVVVRLSRGAGLPSGWPDVLGLSLRHDGGDVLLSSAGLRPLVRHVPLPARDPGRTGYCSLVPYRGPRGPVTIAALPRPPRSLPGDPRALAAALAAEPMRVVLAWAGVEGRWHPFARLDVGGPVGGVGDDVGEPDDVDDADLRFDPLRPPPGLEPYPWVARLRDPAYTAARRNFGAHDRDRSLG